MPVPAGDEALFKAMGGPLDAMGKAKYFLVGAVPPGDRLLLQQSAQGCRQGCMTCAFESDCLLLALWRSA